jgi:hypothetical protein
MHARLNHLLLEALEQEPEIEIASETVDVTVRQRDRE